MRVQGTAVKIGAPERVHLKAQKVDILDRTHRNRVTERGWGTESDRSQVHDGETAQGRDAGPFVPRLRELVGPLPKPPVVAVAFEAERAVEDPAREA